MTARDSDTRITPPWLLDQVRRMGSIALDPCSTVTNPTGAAVHRWDPRDDGLTAEWWRVTAGQGVTYVNCPYSRGQIDAWAQKCVSEAIAGCEILLLTPSDSSTGWFRFLRSHADAVCLLHRRVGFVMPDGTPLPGAKFGSALWYWGRRRALFRGLYAEDLGWVIDLPGLLGEVDRAAE